jgi:hypothetical protein
MAPAVGFAPTPLFGNVATSPINNLSKTDLYLLHIFFDACE